MSSDESLFDAAPEHPEPQEEQPKPKNADSEDSEDSDSDSDSDSDYSYDYDYTYYSPETQNGDVTVPYIRPGDALPESENTPERNIARFVEILDSKRMKRKQAEEDKAYVFYEDLFDFPEDKENWREEDLKELWADAPLQMTKPGWDPAFVDEEDVEVMREEVKAGRDPPIAPFYLPYRKPYPAIPDNHYDIATPKAVIEELDRIEEFLTWVSYIFPDGSSYEGTVWDDLAHGKGVYVAEDGLVRYEGEWMQNNMEGHGVVEVDIPDIEPMPGSKLEAKWRAEGKIISRDFMSPEDRKWLEMDIEDSVRLGQFEVPFYERDEWIKQFGKKPEKGRYRYAGQWKHARMHGCGVYEVNERTIYGRFYFGELVDEATDCDEDISALHAGIAEVAAAKARMFVNKPDGMVREERGPYNDPQHPYFYEEEDVWMAPGFINQFYEVPDYWKRYVQDVDQEREMWLNSFYKAPLRLAMPSELEYWWDNEEEPEFVILNKEPEPDPEDPSKLIYTEDPVILHTRTGRIINFVEDEEHGVRLFWQPPLKDGEDLDLDKVQFLPLGFDEFYGKETVAKRQNLWERILTSVDNACKPLFEKLEKWVEEKQKGSEMKIQLLEKELELVEAELCLEEAIEDLDEELKMQQKEEETNAQIGIEEEDEDTSAVTSQDPKPSVQVEGEEEAEEDEDEEEEDEDVAPSSFGSVSQDDDQTKNDQKGNRRGDLPFSSASLAFSSFSVLSAVPSRLRQSLVAWKERLPRKPDPPSMVIHSDFSTMVNTVSFPPTLGQNGRLKAKSQATQKLRARHQVIGKMAQLRKLFGSVQHPSAFKEKLKMPGLQSHAWLHSAPEEDLDSILSLHTQIYSAGSHADTISYEPLSPVDYAGA